MNELAEKLARAALVPVETAAAWLDGKKVPEIDDLNLAAFALSIGVEQRVSLGWSRMRGAP